MGTLMAARQSTLARAIAPAGALRLALLIPFLAACASAPAARPGRPSLSQVADSAIAAPPLDRTQWGIEVYDPERGRALYRLNPEKHFIPASNAKLVTAAAAMAELGPEYRYRTELYAVGAADSAAGSLVVVGSGDPTMSARFFESDLAPIEVLADSVRAAGIRRITDGLIIDASRFDGRFVHPSWEVGDLPWAYAAPVAAFAIAEAAAQVVVTPGAAPGEPAVLACPEPTEAFTVRNRIVTDSAGARTLVRVERRPGSYDLDLSGTIALDAAPDTLRLSVVEPALHAGRALRAALERRGIDVAGDVRVVYDTVEAAALRAAMRGLDAALPGDTTNASARLIAAWTSPPMREIIAAILEPSQNWIAEQVLKTLGAEHAGHGTWAAGRDVVRRYLIDVVGIDSTAVYLVDGSGLSAQNLLTPHAIVQLLDHVRRQPWGIEYRDALPEPGEPESTLEDRLQGLEGRVHAKTGTITHVNTLGGYVRSADGRDLIFSVMTNASGVSGSTVRRAIDRIVQAIAATGGRE